MRLLCAWCGNPIPSEPTRGDDEVSHGICLTCTESLLEHARDDIAGRAILRGSERWEKTDSCSSV